MNALRRISYMHNNHQTTHIKLLIITDHYYTTKIMYHAQLKI
jgi:hypothetical protein